MLAVDVYTHQSYFALLTAQPKSHYSVQHPMKSRRLTQNKYCSKFVQPVPKADIMILTNKNLKQVDNLS